MALEQKYVGYDTYTPEQHRKQIEANSQAIAQTNQYFVDFYTESEKAKEEAERNEAFNNQTVATTYTPPTERELLEKQVQLLEKLLKESQAKGDK